jgi:hypothetical protein
VPHLKKITMTTARDTLRMTFIFRFRSLTRIDRNYLFSSFEITSIRLYTPLCNPLRYATLRGLHGVIEVISSWTHKLVTHLLPGPLLCCWFKKPYFKIRGLSRIDRNFCSVHEEITSITPCNPRSVAGYTRMWTTWLRLFRLKVLKLNREKFSKV